MNSLKSIAIAALLGSCVAAGAWIGGMVSPKVEEKASPSRAPASDLRSRFGYLSWRTDSRFLAAASRGLFSIETRRGFRWNDFEGLSRLFDSVDSGHPNSVSGSLTWMSRYWSEKGSRWSWQFGTRFSFPSEADRADFDSEWIASSGTVMKARYAFGDGVSLNLRHTLRFHAYRRAGYFSSETGRPRAYRTLENRFRVSLDAELSERWSFSLPLIFQQARYGDFRPEARFNDRWRYAFWIQPELVFALSPDTSLALAYESDTLVSSDLRRMYLGESLAEYSVSAYLSVRL